MTLRCSASNDRRGARCRPTRTIPHYASVEVPGRQDQWHSIMVTVPGRLTECQHCSSTEHWTNKCPHRQNGRKDTYVPSALDFLSLERVQTGTPEKTKPPGRKDERPVVEKPGKMGKEKRTKEGGELEEEARREVVSLELAKCGTAENADPETAPTQTGEIENQPRVGKGNLTEEHKQDREMEDDAEGFQLYLGKKLKRKHRRESSSSSDSPNDQKTLKIVTDDEEDSEATRHR